MSSVKLHGYWNFLASDLCLAKMLLRGTPLEMLKRQLLLLQMLSRLMSPKQSWRLFKILLLSPNTSIFTLMRNEAIIITFWSSESFDSEWCSYLNRTLSYLRTTNGHNNFYCRCQCIFCFVQNTLSFKKAAFEYKPLSKISRTFDWYSFNYLNIP